MAARNEEVRQFIRERYAGVAKGAQPSCCGGGCSCGGPQETAALLGYNESDLSYAPSASNMGLGCGNPIAIAALKEGETVLDFGSGGGFDCFLARKQVSETGSVIGVDALAAGRAFRRRQNPCLGHGCAKISQPPAQIALNLAKQFKSRLGLKTSISGILRRNLFDPNYLIAFLP